MKNPGPSNVVKIDEAGTNPLELFGGRNYTPGVAPVTDNQIHEAGFLYDANGNLISDGVKDFVYDELNQQIEVREVTTSCAAAGQGTGSFESSANAGEEAIPHGTLCYGRGTPVEKNGYDGGGMRVVRETYDPVTSFPKRTTYARLGGNVVKEYAQEYRGPTSPAPELSHEKAYIYGPLGLLATEELCLFNCKSDESAGINVTRYYEYDHLGTVRAITNASGNLESTFDYEPFGLELKGTTASWTTDTSSNTHRFTGHERDEEAGEDYMKARMYVLSTARFPQIDPMFGGADNPQNWNPYIYVLNSPVGSSDPTGMKDEQANSGSKNNSQNNNSGKVDTGPSWEAFDDSWSYILAGGGGLTGSCNTTQQDTGTKIYGQAGGSSANLGTPAPAKAPGETAKITGLPMSQSGPVVSAAMMALFADAQANGLADRLQVNSTVRTTKHNAEIGGSKTLDHVTDDTKTKAAIDVNFYKGNAIVDRQIFNHLRANPSILNHLGHGFQVIFHGHTGKKGLAEHFHLGWNSRRSNNRFTTEASVDREPCCKPGDRYHNHSEYIYDRRNREGSVDTAYGWDH